MVQLSHPYMSAGKAIALTRQTFVSKVMCRDPQSKGNISDFPGGLVVKTLPSNAAGEVGHAGGQEKERRRSSSIHPISDNQGRNHESGGVTFHSL